MRIKTVIWKKGKFERDLVEVRGEGEKDLSYLYAFPCFVDTHAHVLSLGLKKTMLDLESENLEKALSMEKEKLVGRGWTDPPPLDLINSVDYPVALIRKDGHSAVINGTAKEILGFEGNFIYEKDVDRIYDLFDLYDFEKALEVAQYEFFKVGVSYVHSDDLHGLTYDELVEVLKNSKLRIYEKLNVEEPKEWMFKKISERVEIGAVKLFADGSVGSRTAYMKRPYRDTGNRGVYLLDDEKFENVLRFGKDHGVEICVHVIGDAALENVSRFLERYPGNRVIHAQFVPEDLLDVLKGTKFSIQPHFYFEDSEILKFIDTDSLKYPFLEMYEHGLDVSFSSDAPVSPHDPRYVIESALKMGFDLETSIELYTKGSRDWCFYEKPDLMENYPVLIVMEDGEFVEPGGWFK